MAAFGRNPYGFPGQGGFPQGGFPGQGGLPGSGGLPGQDPFGPPTLGAPGGAAPISFAPPITGGAVMRPSPTGYGPTLDRLSGGGGEEPRRPGFSDLTGLDIAGVGAQALGAGLDWWEKRAERKSRERQARELLEEERRQFDTDTAWRQGRADNFATNFSRALEAMYG